MRTGRFNAPAFGSPTFWIRFATLVVVASVGLALAHLTWRLVGWDDGRTRIQTPEALAPVGAGPGGSGGVAAILALAPFGGGPAGADGLPASTLGLVLKGVIYSTTPEASSALIGPPAGPAQTYVVGQSPAGNAILESIEMDRVVLNVGGRREVLAFPRTAATAIVSASPGQSPAQGQSPAPVAAPPDPAVAASLAAASPIATAMAARTAQTAQTAQTPQQGRASAARPAASPAAALAAGLAAGGVAAGVDGYRIGPEAPAQLLRAGLRPGDLIRTVNGRPVGDLTSDSQLFDRASGAGSARVELVRNGRPLTLTFPLR